MRFFGTLALAAVVLAAGCTTNSTSTPAPPSAINNSTTDPPGDTMGTTGTAYDILGVATSRTGPPGGGYTTIQVSVTFAQPVVLPAAGFTPNNSQIAGFIGFDVDGNFSDGSTFGCSTPATSYNFDFAVDMVNSGGRLADGNYPIQSYPGNIKVGEATPSTSGNTLSMTVPIASIGNHQSGPFNLGMELGNGLDPTDCAPDSGYMTTGVSRAPLSIAPASGPRGDAPWRH